MKPHSLALAILLLGLPALSVAATLPSTKIVKQSQVAKGFSRSRTGLNQQVQLVAHSLVDSLSHRDLARSLLATHFRDGSAEEVTTHLADFCWLSRHYKPPLPQPLEQGEGER